MRDCPICAKHRGSGPLVGPVVWQSDLVSVSHRPVGPAGYLFVETVRHVPYLDELSEAEVGAVAHAVWCGSRALRAELSPEYVFSAIAGRGVAHFHQHVFVRHVGTPSDVGWMADWSGAPHLTEVELTEFAERLRGHFTPVSGA